MFTFHSELLGGGKEGGRGELKKKGERSKREKERVEKFPSRRSVAPTSWDYISSRSSGLAVAHPGSTSGLEDVAASNQSPVLRRTQSSNFNLFADSDPFFIFIFFFLPRPLRFPSSHTQHDHNLERSTSRSRFERCSSCFSTKRARVKPSSSSTPSDSFSRRLLHLDRLLPKIFPLRCHPRNIPAHLYDLAQRISLQLFRRG